MVRKTSLTPTRRSVLRNTAVVAGLGGLSATSSAAAESQIDGSITVTGQGSYTVFVAAEAIDVHSDGVSMTITEHDGVDSPLYEIEGTVNGEPNSTPNDYAFITIEGYDDYQHSGSDAGVDVDISIY